MEQKIENKSTLKDKLNNIYQIHKIKIIFLSLIFGIIIMATIFIQQKNKKNNILIAEKYVQAGLQLTANKKENAKNLFEEIILSENKFYSILSLNSIIENGLISDKKIILKYFEILQDLSYSNEKLDLITFKKALYLIKSSERDEGEKLLKNLIKKNSQFKFLAEEVIKN